MAVGIGKAKDCGANYQQGATAPGKPQKSLVRLCLSIVVSRRALASVAARWSGSDSLLFRARDKHTHTLANHD